MVGGLLTSVQSCGKFRIIEDKTPLAVGLRKVRIDGIGAPYHPVVHIGARCPVVVVDVSLYCDIIHKALYIHLSTEFVVVLLLCHVCGSNPVTEIPVVTQVFLGTGL